MHFPYTPSIRSYITSTVPSLAAAAKPYCAECVSSDKGAGSQESINEGQLRHESSLGPVSGPQSAIRRPPLPRPPMLKASPPSTETEEILSRGASAVRVTEEDSGYGSCSEPSRLSKQAMADIADTVPRHFPTGLINHGDPGSGGGGSGELNSISQPSASHANASRGAAIDEGSVGISETDYEDITPKSPPFRSIRPGPHRSAPSKYSNPSSRSLVEMGTRLSNSLHHSTSSIKRDPTTSSIRVMTENFRGSKFSISIDFGAAYSGVIYASTASQTVCHVTSWPGSGESLRKVPTCLVYDALGDVRAWGVPARNMSLKHGWVRCERFKMTMNPALSSRSEFHTALPLGKSNVDAVVDFLSCLSTYTKALMMREASQRDIDAADVYLTVPSSWDARICLVVREAALKARLVVRASPNDHHWQDRLRIIPETEASAIHCAYLPQQLKLLPTQRIMICDAGSVAVDLAIYTVPRPWNNPKIEEDCSRSGSYCGSFYLDLRFRELVRSILAAHPSHLTEASLAHFILTFESVKRQFTGVADDSRNFRFGCLSLEDSHNPEVGLENGELMISGRVLRCEVFGPVIVQVIESIKRQLCRSSGPVDALFLVGGFSASEYLFQCIQGVFNSQIGFITRPSDGDMSSCYGGARSGLGSGPVVTSSTAPESYFMKVRLPADWMDKRLRPAYITNTGGVPMCENRVQYLIHKGTALPKGQKVEVKLRKFSAASFDSVFETVLYAADSDVLMRYTDEGETKELCRCIVDLRVLPSYRQQAEAQPFGGFYIDFELGFDMDGPDIRAMLLCQGHEYGVVSLQARSGHDNNSVAFY